MRPVVSRRDFRTFLKFPWLLYRSDPYWVPPLYSRHRFRYDAHKNESWRDIDGVYFIAWQGKHPVGTLAAFVNHRYNAYQQESTGFFGGLELYDSQLIADALFEQAEAYLRAQGVTTICGPATFSSNDEWGLLIDGFDDAPLILTPYNPSYYQHLIENIPGYVKAMDQYSWRLTLHAAEQSARLPRLYQVVAKNNARRGITVRPLNRKRLSDEFNVIKDIYDSAFGRLWGFVPYTDAELGDLIADMGNYVDQNLVLFGEVHGQPAGILLGVPDIYQALHRAHPRPRKPEVVTRLQMYWHWKIDSKITRVRIPLLGVKEKFWGMGVEAALFVELYQRGLALGPQHGWEYADGGLVLETNDPMNRLCESHNGSLYKRYRIYEKVL